MDRTSRRSRRGAALTTALVAAALAAGCGGVDDRSGPDAATLSGLPWNSVVERARGTEVVWRMWRGDPAVNAFVDAWVAPRLRDRFGIELRTVEGRGPELVNQLVVEREAGASGGSDLVWINGETFHNLREEDLLQGPWAGALPAGALIDSASSIVTRDFEQDPAGYESPWGQVQFALIYDPVRTPEPPRTVEELAQWIRGHPGRFTHDQSFTGITFLKTVMYAVSGGVETLQGGFREEAYRDASTALFDWLRPLTPYFWREGRTYPADVADVHRLFANGEIDFSMSNNSSEAATKVRQGLFPPTARSLVLRDGTIANAHYVGIPFNARNPAGAMVVADFLLSPAAQLEKARPEVWGDDTVLDVALLPKPWRSEFDAVVGRARADLGNAPGTRAVPEVAPEYHERLAADWRRRIREGGR